MTKTKNDDFRGLLYNPALENEAVMLFSMLIPHLGDSFAIEEYSGTFPDCYALRNGQRVGIEFELFASNFNHQNNDNLSKCSILICWENDLRNTIKKDGKDFWIVKGHEIEIIALKSEIESLEKSKNLKFIKYGQRPDIYRSKERFFEQLKENRPRRYEWIRELYNKLKQSEDFEVKWGGGERRITMRFFVKKWDVSPIIIFGDGSIEIGYQENDSFPQWWELPQETKTELQQIFKNPKKKWYDVPLNNETDFGNINKALKVLADHSKRFDKVIWHTKD